MMKKIVLALILLFFASNLKAAAADKKDEDTSITNETLTGGIIDSEGYYLPRSTKIPVVLRTPIDTRFNQLNDMVTVQTTEDLFIGGHVLVPARSFLHGHISKLKAPGKFHRKAKLALEFETLSMPGKAGNRRNVKIKASVDASNISQEAESVNLRGKTYKSKVKKVGAMGAGIGALALHGATRNIPEFKVMGVTALSQFGYLAGGALGGAIIATSLLERDDMRMEPGTELIVTMDDSTLEAFHETHPLSQNHLRGLDPEDAYDKYGEMRSEKLNGLKSKKELKLENANPYLSSI